jgi:hypothetical protein
MANFRRLLVAVIGAVSLVGAGTVSVAAHDGGTLVEFDSMTPVTGAAVGAVNDRGITGGGKAWAITSGSGEVDRQGNVEVQVTGLIIPALGKNPLGSFRATVSCVTPHGVMNVTTDPATTTGASGDAMIRAKVALPHPCKDPIVFVVNGTASASGGFAWFAMSNVGGDD